VDRLHHGLQVLVDETGLLCDPGGRCRPPAPWAVESTVSAMAIVEVPAVDLQGAVGDRVAFSTVQRPIGL
jgi:hypothetical protein